MNLIILCNDKKHPGINVKNCLNYFDDKFILNWIDDLHLFNPENLSNCDVLIISRSIDSWLDDSKEDAIAKFVENGGSLFAIHSGIIENTKRKKISNILGGSFVCYHENCLVSYKPINKSKISYGVDSYHYDDEHYFIELNNNSEIFLKSASKFGVQPAGWRKIHGKGKVSVLTSGHNSELWNSFNNRKIIENVLDWLTE